MHGSSGAVFNQSCTGMLEFYWDACVNKITPLHIVLVRSFSLVIMFDKIR